eukprot:327790-Rhodomonas_salina.2
MRHALSRGYLPVGALSLLGPQSALMFLLLYQRLSVRDHCGQPPPPDSDPGPRDRGKRVLGQ